MNSVPFDFTFNPEQPPPSTAQLAEWQQQLMQELQLYQLLLEKRLFFGAAALLFIGWYFITQPENLGSIFAALGTALLLMVLLKMLLQLIIGNRPTLLQKKIRSLQPIDEATEESLQAYRNDDPGVDHYLTVVGERPIVWAEYWMISLHSSSKTEPFESTE